MTLEKKFLNATLDALLEALGKGAASSRAAVGREEELSKLVLSHLEGKQKRRGRIRGRQDLPHKGTWCCAAGICWLCKGWRRPKKASNDSMTEATQCKPEPTTGEREREPTIQNGLAAPRRSKPAKMSEWKLENGTLTPRKPMAKISHL